MKKISILAVLSLVGCGSIEGNWTGECENPATGELRSFDLDIDIDKLFDNAFKEEAPANSAGSGNIAGIGVGPDGEPGVTKAQQKKKKKVPLKRFRDTAISN